MIRKAALVLSMLFGSVVAASVTDAAYSGEVFHGSPTGKYANGFASYLVNAEFRISADCPASPDRHTDWHTAVWVSYKTGNCWFNWTIVKSYAGLRSR